MKVTLKQTAPEQTREIEAIPYKNGLLFTTKDDKGIIWNLFSFTDQGITIFSSVPAHLGIELYNNTCVKVTHR